MFYFLIYFLPSTNGAQLLIQLYMVLIILKPYGNMYEKGR